MLEKIAGMSRDASPDTKIQAPSIPELKEGFDDAAKRIARTVKFRNRKLRPGPLLNALILYFLTLDEDAQAELAGASLRRYEGLLKHDEPQYDLASVRNPALVPKARHELPVAPPTIVRDDGLPLQPRGEDQPVRRKRRAPAAD